jgi:hypothetical protein
MLGSTIRRRKDFGLIVIDRNFFVRWKLRVLAIDILAWSKEQLRIEQESNRELNKLRTEQVGKEASGPNRPGSKEANSAPPLIHLLDSEQRERAQNLFSTESFWTVCPPAQLVQF